MVINILNSLKNRKFKKDYSLAEYEGVCDI